MASAYIVKKVAEDGKNDNWNYCYHLIHILHHEVNVV